MTMTMLGKFVQFPNSEDPNYAHDGEITEVFGDTFLIRLRNVTDGPPHSRLFPLVDLVAGFVFETEAELTAWRNWEPDTGPHIVVPIREE
jgi:hypothetical protein